jgi:hypothetical protein
LLAEEASLRHRLRRKLPAALMAGAASPGALLLLFPASTAAAGGASYEVVFADVSNRWAATAAARTDGLAAAAWASFMSR